jgi:hypothetical protein
MAKVKLNPIVEQVRGQVGQLVFRQSYGQQVVGRKADTSDREPTPDQVEVREHFRQAALYGRMALADPTARKLYEDAAAKKGKPVFSMVMADFLNAPAIDEVDVSEYTGAQGSPIYIRTQDDFGVERVQVTVAGTDGAQLETGEASPEAGGTGRWVYLGASTIPTGTNVRISVTSTDRPGSIATIDSDKSL